MKIPVILYYFLLVLLLTSCKKTKPTEGYIDVQGGKVWYKIFGSEKNNTPIILLHGGPGGASDYLNPLQALASDRPVVFYDQLGGGRSEHPADKALWEISRFANELAILRNELDLDEIHLFAHSAGTMLAGEYLAQKPVGVKSIIFSGPIMNTNKHLESVNKLKMELPPPIRDTILLHEKRRTIYSQAYQEAYFEFIKLHWCRTFPLPDDIQKTVNHSNSEIFNVMWGDYEFYCTGNLQNFDREHVLKEINVPTLFTCGQFDLTSPEMTAVYAEQVGGAEIVVFDNIAHMTMNEDPMNFVEVVRQFLKKSE